MLINLFCDVPFSMFIVSTVSNKENLELNSIGVGLISLKREIT